MTDEPIFTNWNDTHTALWGHRPLRMEHRLHRIPLFSLESLARLIDAHPRDGYSLIHMGAGGERRFWREGETAGLSGEAVIEAIAKGRMWLNLRNVAKLHRPYFETLDVVFAEMARHLPHFDPQTRDCGILVSSPRAQVYYHSDLSGQHLWQLMGRKRVYVYPNTAPFLTPRHLEDIALYDVEVNMPYRSWYDEHAQVLDLSPGQMLSWPLNAPHRVENMDCLNVSMTVSFSDREISRLQQVNLANGLLRDRLGYEPRSRTTSGPAYWSKAVIQKVLRDSRWVKSQRKTRRIVDFRLDATKPGEILDLEGAA